MIEQGEALRQALLSLQVSISASELTEVLDAATVDILQRGCVAALGLLDAEGLGPSAIDAVCATAGRCIALIGEADLVTPAAIVVREALSTVAALLPPGRPSTQSAEMGAHFTTELAASKALHMLEDVSDHLDYLAVSIFGMLFRAARAQHEAGTEAEPVETKQCQALQGVAVWTLTVLARAVGYDRFNGVILWEWASGDPFCILVLTKGLLTFGLRTTTTLEYWLQAGLNAGNMPQDIGALQGVLLDAILQSAAPDIVFSEGGAMSNEVGIAERNETLSLHRALLAVAVADTGFVDVLLARLEASLSSDALRQLAVAAFFAALVPAPWDSLPLSLKEFTDALAVQMSQRSEKLWSLLSNSIDAIPLSSPLRGAYARSLLKDCATIAYAAPPDGLTCWEVHRRCLSEQSSQICNEIRCNAKALASLVVLSVNAEFEPGSDHLSGTLLTGITPEKRSEVVTALALWQGPIRADKLGAWVALLGSTDQEQVPPLSDEEDNFFELSRREARAAATAAVAAGPPDYVPAYGEPPYYACPGLPLAPPPPPPPPAETIVAEVARVAPVERPPPDPTKPGLRELMCNAPLELVCAIDGRLLVDPVRSPYGQVFERSVLERALLASQGVCPVTRQPLSLEQCPRDATVRKQALTWVRESRVRKPQI